LRGSRDRGIKKAAEERKWMSVQKGGKGEKTEERKRRFRQKMKSKYEGEEGVSEGGGGGRGEGWDKRIIHFPSDWTEGKIMGSDETGLLVSLFLKVPQDGGGGGF
jgi:hypothetical protein